MKAATSIRRVVPLCRREIDLLPLEGADAINWIDVSAADYAGGDGAPT